MNEIALLATALGIMGTICAIVFGYATFKRNKKIDDSTEGKESGTILTEIGYIKAAWDSVPSIQAQIAELKAQLSTTDYQIIKSYEYSLVGLDSPYDIETLHAERQAIRDQINTLENE